MASPSEHKATIIDGKAIAQTIRNEIAAEVHHLSQKFNKVQTKPSILLIKMMSELPYFPTKSDELVQ
jgi:5,10-methylene-tetrahydrofolate dehydrogenase/methenyl tetrahydrofolate cyclohydrolase